MANLSYVTERIDTWREDYVEINTSTITKIYNYLLGVDTTFNEKIDLNKDGTITSADVTEAYNVILGVKRH